MSEPLWQPTDDRIRQSNMAAFMTHAIYPGGAAEKFAALLEEHGADVVAARSLNRRRLETEAPAFAGEVLAAASA